MNHKILTIAIALSAVAAPAMADTVNIGDLYGLNGTDGFAKYASVSGANSVNTDYTFYLSQSAVVHFSLEDSARYSGLSAALSGGGIGAIKTIGTFSGTGGTGSWQSETALPIGNYTVNVVGNYAGNKYAAYTLQLSSDVAAPVPGPAGFIVAGAGALVAVARRRRSKKNDAAFAV